MPTPGLALLGFMDEDFAVNFQQQICVCPDGSPEALRAVWAGARNNLGPASENAGRPRIEEIPASFNDYLMGVMSNPRFAGTVDGLRWSFKLVEIEKVLAFQFHVHTDRSAILCGDGSTAPSMTKLLETCLPHGMESVPYAISPIPNGVIVQSKSSNLRMHGMGKIGEDDVNKMDALGILFGPSSPLLQVVRCDGRCYLRNGYHRAYGFQKAKVGLIPCLFLETDDFAQTGVQGGIRNFSRELLTSDNPPTCAHFGGVSACELQFRTINRFIQVTWSEYSLHSDS